MSSGVSGQPRQLRDATRFHRRIRPRSTQPESPQRWSCRLREWDGGMSRAPRQSSARKVCTRVCTTPEVGVTKSVSPEPSPIVAARRRGCHQRNRPGFDSAGFDALPTMPRIMRPTRPRSPARRDASRSVRPRGQGDTRMSASACLDFRASEAVECGCSSEAEMRNRVGSLLRGSRRVVVFVGVAWFVGCRECRC